MSARGGGIAKRERLSHLLEHDHAVPVVLGALVSEVVVVGAGSSLSGGGDGRSVGNPAGGVPECENEPVGRGPWWWCGRPVPLCENDPVG